MTDTDHTHPTKDDHIHLTIRELKEAIKDMPDDMIVAYQRIEDIYFEKYGWEAEKLRWDYPTLIGYDKDDNKIYEDNISEYIKAFDAYKHPDKEIFVINAHY
jgi:hypothetical protein